MTPTILAAVDDQRIGTMLRAIRIKKRWRQTDVAAKARVSRWVGTRIEQGRLASIPFGKIRAVAAALDARIDATVRWQGGDLPHLLSARHSQMHEVMARYFAGLADWVGARSVVLDLRRGGIIDSLAWHPTRRILLVIELESEIVDVNEMLGTLDRKRRLAAEIARKRGWHPLTVATWLVIAPGRTNRRAIAEHQTVLRAKLPADGAAMRRWLRDPLGSIDALSVLPSVHGMHHGPSTAAIKRRRS